MACDLVLRDTEVALWTVRRALERLPPAREIAHLARAADAELLAQATVDDQPVPAPDAIPGIIDHTLLRADATPADIERVCREAREYAFASVCVHPRFVPLAARMVWGSGVRVSTVIGFPLGASTTVVKALEAVVAIGQGAQELDMVLPLGALKAGALEEVGLEIAAVVAVGHAQDALVKVILETGTLSPAEQVRGCLLAREAGADFVKTSTGFVARGAEERDVRRLRSLAGPRMGVKASGGIRTRTDLERMVRAGASRVGTSSGVEIIRAYREAGAAVLAGRVA
ncbi:MAG TPA: deoxyribose-phosphate aldolase [bacterium]|nr:deoxyribose-phosphate aldolase [bacterium]